MGIYDYSDQLLDLQHHHAGTMSLRDVLTGDGRDNMPAPELYVGQALNIMKTSYTANLLLQHCMKSDVGLRLDSMLPADGSFFDEQENALDISEQNQLFNVDMHSARLGQMIIGLAVGLRKAWHYHKGNGFNPELCVQDLLHLCRSADADTVVFVTLICWELREKGNSSPWKQWSTGENEDVAKAFELTQANYGSTKNVQGLNKALQASYRQWFQHKDRGTASEHTALEKLDRVLIKCRSEDVDTSWIGKNPLTPSTWSRLGEIPGCQNYLNHEKLLKHGYSEQPYDAFNRVHLKHVLEDIS